MFDVTDPQKSFDLLLAERKKILEMIASPSNERQEVEARWTLSEVNKIIKEWAPALGREKDI